VPHKLGADDDTSLGERAETDDGSGAPRRARVRLAACDDTQKHGAENFCCLAGRVRYNQFPELQSKIQISPLEVIGGPLWLT